MRTARRVGACLLSTLTIVAGASTSSTAFAGGFEIPENGTEVMGRAGAWTARADNPLAGAYNPAGLAGIPTALLVNANLTWQSLCFQRAGTYGNENASGTTVGGGADGQYQGAPYPKVCKNNDVGDVNVVPQIAFAWHATDRLGLGFAIVTPSGAGKAEWPDRVTIPVPGATDGSTLVAPAPQRYMLLSQNAILFTPTLSAGYELAHGVRVGLALQNSFAFLKFGNISRGAGAADTFPESPNQDLRGDLDVKAYWAPGAVLGLLFSPISQLDVGAVVRASANVTTSTGSVSIIGPYYGDASKGPSHKPATTPGTVGEFTLPQPLEARIGIRYHQPRAGVVNPKRGDFLATDVFDIELDFLWSHDSQFDNLKLRFPDGQQVFLATASAGTIPVNADVPHMWKDTVAARLGGEYVIVPNLLGVRAGAYFQSGAVDPKYVNIDFLPSTQFGFYVGGTIRAAKSVDVSAGFGKVFLMDVDNAGNGAVYGLAANTPNTCPSPQSFRTCEAVNGGKASGGYVMFSLGATAKF